MDWSLREVDPSAPSRVSVLKACHFISAWVCCHSIYVPRIPLCGSWEATRWRFREMCGSRWVVWRHSYLLTQHHSLPVYLYAIYHLLPLLQYLQAFQEANLHKPPLFCISHYHGYLSALPHNVFRLVLRMALRFTLTSRTIQGVLNEYGDSQLSLLLRLREILYWVVQPLLRDAKVELQKERPK